MAAIRIISWNIFNFAAGKSGVLSRTDSIDRVLEVVHPATAAASCDIFVIIEPVTKKGTVGGVAVGGGPSGGTQILGMLQGRATGGPDWRLANPLCIYSKAKGETVLVFYRSTAVSVQAGPILLSNVPTAVMPNWRILSARESCPFHVTFRDLATGTDFELIAQHAPSPSYGKKKNRKANEGVREVGEHASVLGATKKVVYLGDLNLCSVPSPPACEQSGHTEDRTTLNNMALAAQGGLTLVSDTTRSSLKKDAATWDNYREHAYDNILAKGYTTANNAGVIDLVQPLITQYLASNGATSIAANVFRSGTVFAKVRIGKNRGISDHLPVKISIDF